MFCACVLIFAFLILLHCSYTKLQLVMFNNLYVMVFHRLAGSYEALEAGNPAEALVDFTGGVSEYIDLVSGNYANDLEARKQLFQKLHKYMDRQSMTSASIKVFSAFLHGKLCWHVVFKSVTLHHNLA